MGCLDQVVQRSAQQADVAAGVLGLQRPCITDASSERPAEAARHAPRRDDVLAHNVDEFDLIAVSGQPRRVDTGAAANIQNLPAAPADAPATARACARTPSGSSAA